MTRKPWLLFALLLIMSYYRACFSTAGDTLSPGHSLSESDTILSKDPAPGVFSLGLNPNGSNQFFFEWNKSQIYWSSDVWNETSFSVVHDKSFIFNCTFMSSEYESERYFTYSLYNPSNLAKYRVDQTGQIKAHVWQSGVSIWTTLRSGPTNYSVVYALCGAFGVVQYLDNLLLFDFDIELYAINDGNNTDSNLKKREKDAELSLFSYESVLAATNNFSAVNKLGERGFGLVYKGKLLRGQKIEVKMLSKRSGQGIEEFRNETILIAKLQHRNLVSS
ncbi:G-type lectin S-receptor-like serine/threonine-protein kinase At2g19130 [Corylus avellana]|uniref:G-type lectin S-receptor-like serine/threonine-protein kinase At2g19130 n=1 Tax=Corylus avellana TaxID=13451 RepID=UPI00286C4E30|nr:G-type lectin S-receptor-like serine/threonine-protein kinase At2g19130 [Corylus avellana]